MKIYLEVLANFFYLGILFPLLISSNQNEYFVLGIALLIIWLVYVQERAWRFVEKKNNEMRKNFKLEPKKKGKK